MTSTKHSEDALAGFHPAVARWFVEAFSHATSAQAGAWPALLAGESTLLLAPTGSGKTLAAFLHTIDRLMFSPKVATHQCSVIYVSPLKALAVDVERNLRAPLAGIANVAAQMGTAFTLPTVMIRTGDTPARERARFLRRPTDILITTPESLYLMLTSGAREGLRAVRTVIIDEIHALVPTKRGAHLALSLERLAILTGKPLQRVGLSATQKPLDEVARYLGGVENVVAPEPNDGGADPLSLGDTTADTASYRPVTIVNPGTTKKLSLRVELPIEATKGEPTDAANASIWAAIHPRLLQLVREHRSTLIFVNSRRIAERLAGALNELATETLVYAHHGSLAPDQRAQVENLLKAGLVRGLVATSSLELGIDMGAIDLVVQIEAPPSVASGLQRIGRGGHQVGATSQGVLFPKYRSDLLACAAITRAMNEGNVEPTAYPRNALDVLAQQIVAMVSVENWEVKPLYNTVRKAAPYAQLPLSAFENLLDMLAGRYESDDFAELRPRITWDRNTNTLSARQSARRVAIANAGTIPDRGLYGVFLAGKEKTSHARIGELDEEMVFESRVGETFVLGASTWRIEEITHDRVFVSPAAGEAGKMPFWRGESVGRSVQLGREVGALVRELRTMQRPQAQDLLIQRNGLDRAAAEILLNFLAEQATATRVVPDEITLVIERCRDELGDWRVCILSPLGGRVHAPWAMALTARVRQAMNLDVETMWTDDGIVIRFPESENPPDVQLLLPEPHELTPLLMSQLGNTAVFAARFREAAGRALLLPRRFPGRRAPLWHTRKRASDLLSVAAKTGSFPILLEAYRECLRDTFDLPSLLGVLRDISTGSITVHTVDTRSPSPFAATLLFGFVANYIYDGDAPIHERRAQALAIDHTQLRQLLGEAQLRELIDSDVLKTLQTALAQPIPKERLRSADDLASLLAQLGDLSREQIEEKMEVGAAEGALATLLQNGRALILVVGGSPRIVAIEYASRYRDALGVGLPPNVPEAFSLPVQDPLGDLLMRYARTHGPFTSLEAAAHWGVPVSQLQSTLLRLSNAQKIIEGAFRPGGKEREWCATEVLATLRRLSLFKLRKQIEPVSASVLARAALHWQGLVQKRGGLDSVMDACEKLQGAALPASLLESHIFPARVSEYLPGDLDALASSGELVWVGVSAIGAHDGRIAIYLTDALPTLWIPPKIDPSSLSPRESAIRRFLETEGASFFAAVHVGTGAGFQNETIQALWSLVWKGLVTNDTFAVLRAYTKAAEKKRRDLSSGGRSFRSRRSAPPAAEGRWSLIEPRTMRTKPATDTERATALANQLLHRHPLVSRDVMANEDLPGGFTAVYDTLKAMEEAGRIRRGYFVAGVAATQFAQPAALELLRSLRSLGNQTESITLCALDPANPYGSVLPWPQDEGDESRKPSRTVGAYVVLVDGILRAYLARGLKNLRVWLADANVNRAVADQLAKLARTGGDAVLVAAIDGISAGAHPFAQDLEVAGFSRTPSGLQMRRSQR